jgi:predicted TIM-barrel fold metal-dependent hydrolase
MLTVDGEDILAVDSQIHIWRPHSEAAPWPDAGRAYAHRGGVSPTGAELLRDMDDAGVDGAILIPPSFAGYDNEYALDVARSAPDRFAVMGRIAVDDQSDRGALKTWRQTPGMLGIRITFSRGAARGWIADGTADWFWEEAESAGIPVMVYVPRRTAELASVAERYPRLRLIVDHAGLPSHAPPIPVYELVSDLLPLARFGNVAVKASALPGTVAEDYPFPTAQEAARRIVEAFGKSRVFWGTDVTRLPCTYAEAVTFLTEPGGLDPDDLSWVMGRSLTQWLDWDFGGSRDH